MNTSAHDPQVQVHLNDRWSQFHCHVFKTTSGRTDDALTFLKTPGNAIKNILYQIAFKNPGLQLTGLWKLHRMKQPS